MNEVQYLGHSSFRFLLGDVACYIDPVVSRKINGEDRVLAAAFDPAAVRKCDTIYITSEKEGHFEPRTIEQICERTYSLVVAPKPVLERLNVPERFKVDVRSSDRFSIKGIDTQVIKAVYPQAQHPVGFLLHTPQWRIYHSGSTYQFNEMGAIKCDIAILPIGGTYTMDWFAAINACKEIRPKYAIPMMYGTTKRLNESAGEFSRSLPEYVRPIVLRPGATAKLP